MKHFIELVSEQVSEDIRSAFKLEVESTSVISMKTFLSTVLVEINNFKEKLKNIGSTCFKGFEKDKPVFEDLSLFRTEDQLFSISNGVTALVEIEKVVKTEIIAAFIDKLKLKMKDPDSKIEHASALLDQEIAEYEEKILSVLKRTSLSTENHILISLRELSKWNSLLSRPRVALKIEKMRIFMVKSLAEFTVSVFKRAEARLTESIEDIEEEKQSDYSDTVNDVLYLNSCKLKLENCLKNSGLLQATEGFKEVRKGLDKAIREIDSKLKDCLNGWRAQHEANEISIPTTIGDIIEINPQTGQLLVNFSEELFTFLRDSRVLLDADFGREIGETLLKKYELGKKYYSDAISLKEISTFYSMLSSDITETMKPMLSRSVSEFSGSLKLLIEKAKLNTSSANLKNYSIDMFLSSLKSASDSLTAEVESLKERHNAISGLVAGLFKFSLLNQKYKWKQNLVKINILVEEVKEKYEADLTKEWLRSWDFQVFKVLKSKFRQALKAFNAEINEVSTSAEIRGQIIVFSPSFEEVKTKLYKEIEALVSIPLKITHFSDKSDYFQVILDENRDLIEQLYNSVDANIDSLLDFKRDLQFNLGIVFLDVEEFAKEHFTQNSHWVSNFKLVSAKRKEMTELDNEQRVGCFRVNLVGFKVFN